jgi:hypothetical protein
MRNSISIKIVSLSVKIKSVIGLYVVPTSNCCVCSDAYLCGIPCRVVSKPYIKKCNLIGIGEVDEKVVDVVSLLTGIKYTTYAEWCDVYLFAEDAIKNSKLKTEYDQTVSSIIGMKYYPKDNSYIEDKNGNWKSLIGKETVVCSLPYVAKTDTGKEKTFVNVMYQGNVYRTLFEEWCFYEDDREPFDDEAFYRL